MRKHPKPETGIEAAPRRHKDIIDREIVRDSRLSLRALGAAVRLLSNAPGYRMTSLDLARERPSGEGRDAVRTALGELETVGYLHRQVVRLPNGHCVTKMVIADTLTPAPENPASVSAPKPENPEPGFPAVGRSGAKSSRSSKKKISNSKNTTTTLLVLRARELTWPHQLTPEQVVVVMGLLTVS